MAFLSKALVLLNCDVKLNKKMKDLAFDSFPSKEVSDFLKKWELNSLLQHVPGKIVVKQEAEKKKTPHTKYTLVNTPKLLERLAEELKEAEVIAIDTETTGLDVLTVDLVGLCLSTAEKKGWYVPIAHDDGENIELSTLQKKLKPILNDKDKKFIFHNAKYDLPILARHNLVPALKGKDQLIDTLIAAFLDNPGSRGLSPAAGWASACFQHSQYFSGVSITL